MTDRLDTAVARIRELPASEQDQAADLLLNLADAAHDQAYVIDPDERIALEQAMAQVERGEFATDEQMAALWKKCGL